MKHFIGLDVSMKTTSICIVNQNRKIIFEDIAETDPTSIFTMIKNTGLEIEKIALESGSVSHWLIQKLCNRGLPVICIDARKMSKILSININKTDKNDARLIAEALCCGFYSEVIQKTQDLAEIKVLLGSRRTLLDVLVKLKNTIRGHLKIYGIRLGALKHQKFACEVRRRLEDKSEVVQIALNGLLKAFDDILVQLNIFEKKIKEMAKEDDDIKLLMTIPGVGIITAFTFKVHLGDPSRFKKSRSVAAYFGMTPTQYSSGDTTRQGKISKCGSAETRTMLSDAATSMLYRTKSWSRIKAWGLKIQKKKGHKKAIMAIGRKLCTVMHRMMVERKPFIFGEPETKQNGELAKAI
jgi:transposase